MEYLETGSLLYNAHLITRIDPTDPPAHLPSPHTDHYRRSRLNTGSPVVAGSN